MQKEFETKNIVLNKNISADTKDLLKNMLRVDSDDRCDIRWVLRHPAITKNIHKFKEPIREEEFSIMLRNYMINTRGNQGRHMPEGLADIVDYKKKSIPKDFFGDIPVINRSGVSQPMNYNFFDDDNGKNGVMPRKSRDYRIFFSEDPDNKVMGSLDSHAPRGQIFERISNLRKSRSNFFDQFGQKPLLPQTNDISTKTEQIFVKTNIFNAKSSPIESFVDKQGSYNTSTNRFADFQSLKQGIDSYLGPKNQNSSQLPINVKPNVTSKPLDYVVKSSNKIENFNQTFGDKLATVPKTTTPFGSYTQTISNPTQSSNNQYYKDNTTYTMSPFSQTNVNNTNQTIDRVPVMSRTNVEPSYEFSKFGQNNLTESTTFNQFSNNKASESEAFPKEKSLYDSYTARDSNNVSHTSTNWVNAHPQNQVTTRRLTLDKPISNTEPQNRMQNNPMDFGGSQKLQTPSQFIYAQQYNNIDRGLISARGDNYNAQSLPKSLSSAKIHSTVNQSDTSRYNEDKFGFKNFMFTQQNKVVRLEDDVQKKLDSHLSQQSVIPPSNLKNLSTSDLSSYKKLMEQALSKTTDIQTQGLNSRNIESNRFIDAFKVGSRGNDSKLNTFEPGQTRRL